MQPQVVQLIQKSKLNADPNARLVLNIQNENCEVIGSLACLDRGYFGDDALVVALTRWRSRFMKFFLTQFEATVERTSKWIETSVLPSTDRILFLIYDNENNLIGNFGVCNISEATCELDNLIRGEKGGDPRLIFFAEIRLLAWLFIKFGFETVNLHVFSNNLPTLRLHQSVGFAEVRRHQLSRVNETDVTTFLVDSQVGEPVDFMYCELAISREIFFQRYPWVRGVS